MLYVSEDGTIKLTRGDSARLSLTISNELTSSGYTIAAEDTIKLTVKKSVNDTTPSLQKTIVGSNMFHIIPADTKSLLFGKYLYDVELTTSSGDVYTVIGPSIFEVLKEVT